MPIHIRKVHVERKTIRKKIISTLVRGIGIVTHYFKKLYRKTSHYFETFDRSKILTKRNIQTGTIIIIFSSLILLFYYYNRERDPFMEFYKGIDKAIYLEKSNPTVIFEMNSVDNEPKYIAYEVYISHAPLTANHFIELVNSGLFNNLGIEKVINDLVLQFKDPLKLDSNTLKISPSIPLEISPVLNHKTFGTLGLSRDLMNPNSGSAQIYVTIGKGSKAFLDGSYAIFGQVVAGKEIIEKLTTADTVKQARVIN